VSEIGIPAYREILHAPYRIIFTGRFRHFRLGDFFA
jgi:hypothetical protein